MDVPPQGDQTAGQPLGGQDRRRGRTPALTEDMLIRRGGSVRSRGSLRRKKSADPPAPSSSGRSADTPGANRDHVTAGHPSHQASFMEPPAPAGGSGDEPPGERVPAKGGRGGKKTAKADTSSGNGWFHNPFAVSKAGSSAADRSNVSSAQMWAGPRRGILIRRMLGIFALFLLLFLFVKVSGKASKTQVDAAVDARLKASAQNFPRGAAVMWAAPLVKMFADYDADHADDRSRALQPYAINGLDQQLGWNGQGQQTVIDLVMSDDVEVTSADRAVVRGTVQVQDGSWRCVAVPVYMVKRGGSMAFGLTATPVYVPCAGLTSPPKGSSAGKTNDSALAETLESDLLPPFLAAWAQSDSVNLARYLLPGTVSFGLGGGYTGAGDGGRPSVDNVYVPVADKGQDPNRRLVRFTTTLVSADGKASQTSMYQVAIVKQNGQWYFASDPTPAVGAVGGDALPDVQPSQGTGGMYSQSPAPYPRATTSTDVQQP